MRHDNLVSVVIPTRNRPEMVRRAVHSALDQTHREVEVIVVIDGPDPATVASLDLVQDKRLRIVDLAESVGGNEARNIGIRNAQGVWVGLLDDDDEWLPEKLERQIARAPTAEGRNAIIACRAYVERSVTKVIWPLRLPLPGEDISEYVFCRSGVGQGEGLLISSMLLAPRSLFLEVPFDRNVRRHQDTDWILRAMKSTGAHLVWAEEPLVIFNLEVNRKSVSRSMDVLPSWTWGNRNALLTKRAYAYFIATQLAPRIDPIKHPIMAATVIAAYASRGEVSLRSAGLLLAFLFTSSSFRTTVIRMLRPLIPGTTVNVPTDARS